MNEIKDVGVFGFNEFQNETDRTAADAINLTVAAPGLCGESGEFADHIKKFVMKLRKRFPDGFSTERSINRSENLAKDTRKCLHLNASKVPNSESVAFPDGNGIVSMKCPQCGESWIISG